MTDEKCTKDETCGSDSAACSKSSECISAVVADIVAQAEVKSEEAPIATE